MEKMVLLFLAICLLESFAVYLRLNDPSLSNIRLYPKMFFLPPLVPALATENLKKVSTGSIRMNIPTIIFHVKNTSKISFSPDSVPGASGG